MEEIESEEDDEYGRELVRSGRYMRQLEYGARGPRRRLDYEDLTDENDSVIDGGDYDLYDHEDSTVAYAVQLAMRDKEDQLVDKALERIRRAQVLGKKNVRLTQRELDALERKRQQTGSSSGLRRKPAGNAGNSRPVSRRGPAAIPEDQAAPYSFAPDSDWSRPPAATHGRPSSSSSAHRPRTPTDLSIVCRALPSYWPATVDAVNAVDASAPHVRTTAAGRPPVGAAVLQSYADESLYAGANPIPATTSDGSSGWPPKPHELPCGNVADSSSASTVHRWTTVSRPIVPAECSPSTIGVRVRGVQRGGDGE